MSEEAAITPMPFPTGVAPTVVLLVGGSFDPVHVAHTALSREVAERLGGGGGNVWRAFVPAARSPHKGRGPVASPEQRQRWLRLAMVDEPRAIVWTDEVDRSDGGPSYSIDTARRARAWLDAHGHRQASLRWLMGADQLLSLHRWREPRGLMAVATPAVMLRGTTSPASLMADLAAQGAWSGPELAELERCVVPTGLMDVSSTRVREMLSAPEAHGQELGAALHVSVLRDVVRDNPYTLKDGRA